MGRDRRGVGIPRVEIHRQLPVGQDGTSYPAVLLTTGVADPRVAPFHAAKMTARLQAASKSGKPIAASRSTPATASARGAQQDREAADTYAFLLWQLKGANTKAAKGWRVHGQHWMEPRIRILTAADAPELFALRRGALIDSPFAFLASPSDDLATSEAAVSEMLKRAPTSVVFGAVAPQLVGLLGLHRAHQLKAAHKVNLWGMYVAPAWRKRGLGEKLLEAAISYARTLPGVSTRALERQRASERRAASLRKDGLQVLGRRAGRHAHRRAPGQ